MCFILGIWRRRSSSGTWSSRGRGWASGPSTGEFLARSRYLLVMINVFTRNFSRVLAVFIILPQQVRRFGGAHGADPSLLWPSRDPKTGEVEEVVRTGRTVADGHVTGGRVTTEAVD